MNEVKSYRDLETWQVAMEAVLATYRLSSNFPDEERYGLVAQLRRAAVSVPSNIAEGRARRSPKAILNHLSIAIGSLAEVDTQIEIAIRLRYVSALAAKPLQDLIVSCRRLTYGMRRAQRARLGLTAGASGLVLFLGLRLFT